MDKRYKSGAEKRKLKATKEQKNQELLLKIPKLTSIFQKGSVDDSSKSPNADSTTEENKRSNDAEFSNAGNNVSGNSDKPSCCEFLETEATTSNIFSNDPGLWPVEFNQSILQDFWVKKGSSVVLYLFIKIS